MMDDEYTKITMEKIKDLLDRKPPWQLDLEEENKRLRAALKEADAMLEAREKTNG